MKHWKHVGRGSHVFVFSRVLFFAQCWSFRDGETTKNNFTFFGGEALGVAGREENRPKRSFSREAP